MGVCEVCNEKAKEAAAWGRFGLAALLRALGDWLYCRNVRGERARLVCSVVEDVVRGVGENALVDRAGGGFSSSSSVVRVLVRLYEDGLIGVEGFVNVLAVLYSEGLVDVQGVGGGFSGAGGFYGGVVELGRPLGMREVVRAAAGHLADGGCGGDAVSAFCVGVYSAVLLDDPDRAYEVYRHWRNGDCRVFRSLLGGRGEVVPLGGLRCGWRCCGRRSPEGAFKKGDWGAALQYLLCMARERGLVVALREAVDAVGGVLGSGGLRGAERGALRKSFVCLSAARLAYALGSGGVRALVVRECPASGGGMGAR